MTAASSGHIIAFILISTQSVGKESIRARIEAMTSSLEPVPPPPPPHTHTLIKNETESNECPR